MANPYQLISIEQVDGLAAALESAANSPTSILAALLTVDGPGSGLNADLLDGFNSDYFLPFASYTAADVLSKLLTVDGAGSTIDADLLDGQHGSYYANSTHTHTFASLTSKPTTLSGYGITDALGLAGGTLTGNLTIAKASPTLTFNDTAQTAPSPTGLFRLYSAAGNFYITRNTSTVRDFATETSMVAFNGTTGVASFNTSPFVGSDIIWHAGNDGAASGLDADLLDGQHGSWYAPIANPTFTGTVTTPDLTVSSGIINGIGSSASVTLNDGVGSSLIYGTSRFTVGGPIVFVASGVERFRVNSDGTTSFSSSSITANGNAIWHAGNDGAASGLDADLLDGQHGSWYANSTHTHTFASLTSKPTTISGYGITDAVLKTGDTMTGRLLLTGGGTYAEPATIAAVLSMDTVGGDFTISSRSNGGSTAISFRTSSSGTGAERMRIASNGAITFSSTSLTAGGNVVWHAGNDGSGSGLDADLLDGRDNTGYMRRYSGVANSDATTNSSWWADSADMGVSYISGGTNYPAAASGIGGVYSFKPFIGASNSAYARSFEIFKANSVNNSLYVRGFDGTGVGTPWALLWSDLNDGSGSGLDADLLDGQHGSYYLTASTYTAADVLSKLLTVDGSGSSLDADLLDGYHASSFPLKAVTIADATDMNTMTDSGFYRMSATFTNGPSGASGYGNMLISRGSDTMSQIYMNYTSANMWWRSGSGVGTGTFTGASAWRLMWNSANDGSGSGLDADLLDGQEGSYYLPASSYTAADVRTKLLTVDGAGTGIDADLLDGQHGSYYLTASIYTAADVLSKLLTVDGAASGLDADLLDGQHGSYYQNASNINAGTLALGRVPSQLVRSGGTGGTNWNDASSTLNGFSGLLLGTATNGPSGAVYFHPWTIEYDNSGNLTQIAIPYGDSSAINAGLSYRGRYDGTWTSWQKIWTSSNDGASSGLDADLLDGQHGSYYLTASSYTAADVLSKLLTVDGAGSGIDADLLDGLSSAAFALKSGDTIGTTTMAAVNSAQGLLLKSGTATGVWLAYYSDSAAQATRSGYVGYGGVSLPHFQIYNERSGGHIELYTTGGGLLKFNSASVWHASNDGAGSGLDADLLDGVHSSGFLQLAGSAQDVTVRKRFTSSAGTTIGDIYANSYLNSALEVYNGDGNRPAYMSFHITGIAGVTFGLNTNAWLATNAAGMQINGNKVVHAGDFSNSNNLTPVAADTLAKNGISYVTSMSLLGQTDGALYTQAYSTDWQHQIFGDYRTGQIAIRGKNSGTWQAWRTVWDSSNDGAASGLDADLLDGLQGSAYATLAGANVFTNQQWVNSGGTSILAGSGNGYVMLGQRQSATESVPLVGVGYSSISLQLGYGVKSSPSAASFVSSYSGALNRAIIDIAGDIAFYTSGVQTVTVDSAITLTERMRITTAGAVTIAGSTVWHAGNDGSGSGLDADLLDGLNSASAATASTIVARDASAQVFASNQCVSVAAGAGLRLWGGDSGYSIYMSDAANGTWGGRVTSELNSDYNMYFKMSGSTRGYVFLNNTTAVAGIDDTGNIRSKNMVRSSNGFADIGTTMGAGYSARYINPGGGSYTTGTSVITGAIKIRLPNLNSNAMFRMRVEVYNYSAGTSETFVISGYPYNPTWANCSAEQYTDSGTVKKTVRFGNDGTKNCVWIGEVGQVWSYPQVFVTEFSHGYSGHTSGWEGGWGVSFVTAFDTVNITRAAAYHWNSSNDGASSGLDADLLDGQEGSYYRSATNINAGTLSDSYLPTTMAGKTFTSRVTVSGVSEGVRVASDTGYYSWYNTANNTRWAYIQHNGTMTFANEVSNSNTNFVTTGTGTVRINSNLAWHAGNDGAGSGLDADLLDGYASSTTSDAASTIPVRDGSGYMNQRVIRNASGSVTDGMYIGYGNAASGSTRIYGGGSTTTNLTIQATSMTAPGEVYTPSGSYFRAQGTGGFYCETYNGGWNMTDGTWIRSIADKGIITGGAIQGATVTATSDRRLKTEIQPLTGFGDVIDQTNVYSFIKDGTRQWGVIAQEVLETPAALLVHEGGTIHEEDGDAILTVDFAGFTYALLAEVKELRQRVAAMEARQ